MNKVKCPKCGHMNHPNEEHCSNCGYRLKQTKEASSVSFLQSMYKTAMACPRAAGDVELNTKNRDKTIQRHNYGPLNLNDKGYWEFVADKWNTTPEVAKKSTCGNCVAFDVSPRMDDCMPGQVSDGEGRLGYCWMHHFKCHSARTCTTWAKGGPIKKDEVSHDWQKKSKGMEKEAEDSSVKSDILKAFKAEGGALGMKALKKHVKAPDVQARLKDLMEEGRVYKHRHGDFIEKESSAVMPLVVGGGLVGAGIGAATDRDNRLRGAAIGGGIGALGGFAGGKAIDHAVDTDPGVIKARAGAAKAEADLRQTRADSKAQAKKLDADLAEAKKRTSRAREATKQVKARLEQVTADEKAGKISPMEAVNRRVKILQDMSGLEKKARMLPGQFSGATNALARLGRIPNRAPVTPFKSKATPTAASSMKTRLDDIYAQYQKKQSALNSRYATKLAAEGEYDDSHMLSKILMRMSAQSAHLKEKIDAGLVIPSWAEYKLYNAYSSLGSALGTAYPGEYDKEAAATATKTDPAKWEAAKREAKAKMGGKHSARAMQLATQIYKKKGGGYSGAKPSSSNNSLKKWTKQDWGYSGKDKPGQGGSGVYLPKRRRAALKATKKGRSMLASATRKKHKATLRGQQYSSHGLAAGTSLKKTAESSERSDIYAGLGAGGLGAGAILSNKPQKLIHKGGVHLVKNTGGAEVTPEEMQELSKKHGIQIQAGDKSSLRKFTDGSTRITLGGGTGNHATLAHELGHAKDKKKGGLIDKSKLKKGSLRHTLATLRNEGVANIYAVQDRGLKQIPNAIGSYATYLAGAAGRHRKGLAAMSVAPLGIGGYAASKSLRDREKTASSSRVKSPHAFYQPTQVIAPPPEMNPGNTETVNQQAQNHAMSAKNREQQYQGMAPQPAPPSIQQNSPAVPQPFKPKYTGMP